MRNGLPGAMPRVEGATVGTGAGLGRGAGEGIGGDGSPAGGPAAGVRSASIVQAVRARTGVQRADFRATGTLPVPECLPRANGGGSSGSGSYLLFAA